MRPSIAVTASIEGIATGVIGLGRYIGTSVIESGDIADTGANLDEKYKGNNGDNNQDSDEKPHYKTGPACIRFLDKISLSLIKNSLLRVLLGMGGGW